MTQAMSTQFAVLVRVGGRVLHELVVEREEEEHDPGGRKHEVEQRVELELAT